MKTKIAFLMIAGMLLMFTAATANYLFAFQGDRNAKKKPAKTQQVEVTKSEKKHFSQSPLSPDMNPDDPTTQMNAAPVTPMKIESAEEVGCKTEVSPMSTTPPCKEPEKPKKSRSKSSTQICNK
ncbi:MAG: hypothetical protein U0T73_12185 [Chitinophagales bacterium]